MAFKAIVLCVSALMIQCISGQCGGCVSYSAPSCGCSSGSNSGGYSSGYSSGYSGGYSGSSSSIAANSIAIPSSGGGFPVTSVGPIVPTGIAVASDIGLAGTLDVNGVLPFLSAVGFQGNYDTTGSGSVCYSCGDSCGVGINSVIGGSTGSGYSGSGCGCQTY